MCNTFLTLTCHNVTRIFNPNYDAQPAAKLSFSFPRIVVVHDEEIGSYGALPITDMLASRIISEQHHSQLLMNPNAIDLRPSRWAVNTIFAKEDFLKNP